MENTLSLTRDRLLKWQANCKVNAKNSHEQLSCRKRVKRIFDMKTILEIETHDQLWKLMEKKPGWIREEKEGDQIDYLLISSKRKCWAKASLPSNLGSASPDVLRNFVSIVNKFEHTDVFAVWETFKVFLLPSQKNSVVSHHGESESSSSSKHISHSTSSKHVSDSSSSKHVSDRHVRLPSVTIMPRKLYSG